ncbi:hypothetical protein BESB_076950 [Besnoitia besnoiti]|uniref:SET domain-containing protein n=1 Tax=Besnoitia besnoiti TaxID=94643 RepID=A0A2A9M4R7_BESBE|nr:hypothetical protein BESB_076950 [Besnoitia besnoiti]PFH33478.1 hypothetical protein BESB_076950 [Besnoitia besnoiti]
MADLAFFAAPPSPSARRPSAGAARSLPPASPCATAPLSSSFTASAAASVAALSPRMSPSAFCPYSSPDSPLPTLSSFSSLDALSRFTRASLCASEGRVWPATVALAPITPESGLGLRACRLIHEGETLFVDRAPRGWFLPLFRQNETRDRARIFGASADFAAPAFCSNCSAPLPLKLSGRLWDRRATESAQPLPRNPAPDARDAQEEVASGARRRPRLLSRKPQGLSAEAGACGEGGEPEASEAQGGNAVITAEDREHKAADKKHAEKKKEATRKPRDAEVERLDAGEESERRRAAERLLGGLRCRRWRAGCKQKYCGERCRAEAEFLHHGRLCVGFSPLYAQLLRLASEADNEYYLVAAKMFAGVLPLIQRDSRKRRDSNAATRDEAQRGGGGTELVAEAAHADEGRSDAAWGVSSDRLTGGVPREARSAPETEEKPRGDVFGRVKRERTTGDMPALPWHGWHQRPWWKTMRMPRYIGSSGEDEEESEGAADSGDAGSPVCRAGDAREKTNRLQRGGAKKEDDGDFKAAETREECAESGDGASHRRPREIRASRTYRRLYAAARARAEKARRSLGHSDERRREASQRGHISCNSIRDSPSISSPSSLSESSSSLSSSPTFSSSRSSSVSSPSPLRSASCFTSSSAHSDSASARSESEASEAPARRRSSPPPSRRSSIPPPPSSATSVGSSGCSSSPCAAVARSRGAPSAEGAEETPPAEDLQAQRKALLAGGSSPTRPRRDEAGDGDETPQRVTGDAPHALRGGVASAVEAIEVHSQDSESAKTDRMKKATSPGGEAGLVCVRERAHVLISRAAKQGAQRAARRLLRRRMQVVEAGAGTAPSRGHRRLGRARLSWRVRRLAIPSPSASDGERGEGDGEGDGAEEGWEEEEAVVEGCGEDEARVRRRATRAAADRSLQAFFRMQIKRQTKKVVSILSRLFPELADAGILTLSRFASVVGLIRMNATAYRVDHLALKSALARRAQRRAEKSCSARAPSEQRGAAATAASEGSESEECGVAEMRSCGTQCEVETTPANTANAPEVRKKGCASESDSFEAENSEAGSECAGGRGEEDQWSSLCAVQGLALFPVQSCINHACLPNCCWLYEEPDTSRDPQQACGEDEDDPVEDEESEEDEEKEDKEGGGNAREDYSEMREKIGAERLVPRAQAGVSSSLERSETTELGGHRHAGFDGRLRQEEAMIASWKNSGHFVREGEQGLTQSSPAGCDSGAEATPYLSSLAPLTPSYFRLAVVASRPILPGEEITSDYFRACEKRREAATSPLSLRSPCIARRGAQAGFRSAEGDRSGERSGDAEGSEEAKLAAIYGGGQGDEFHSGRREEASGSRSEEAGEMRQARQGTGDDASTKPFDEAETGEASDAAAPSASEASLELPPFLEARYRNMRYQYRFKCLCILCREDSLGWRLIHAGAITLEDCEAFARERMMQMSQGEG